MSAFQLVLFLLLAVFIFFVLVAGVKMLMGWVGLMIGLALFLTAFGFFYIISQGNDIQL